MPKFSVVKQKVYIVEASNDAEANIIVTNGLSTGAIQDSEQGFYAAEYTKIYAYGHGDVITTLSMEYEPERDESRRVSGYTDISDTTEV